MLKKLFINKKLLILIVVAILLLIGVVIAVITTNHSKEVKKPNGDVQIETDSDGVGEQSDDTAKDYNGNGLEVQDTMDESVYTIDGSGDWDGTSDDDSKKKQDNKTDSTKSDDKQSDNTQSDDTKKEESNNKDDNVDGELEEDILIDDKVWGEPS